MILAILLLQGLMPVMPPPNGEIRCWNSNHKLICVNDKGEYVKPPYDIKMGQPPQTCWEVNPTAPPAKQGAVRLPNMQDKPFRVCERSRDNTHDRCIWVRFPKFPKEKP